MPTKCAPGYSHQRDGSVKGTDSGRDGKARLRSPRNKLHAKTISGIADAGKFSVFLAARWQVSRRLRIHLWSGRFGGLAIGCGLGGHDFGLSGFWLGGFWLGGFWLSGFWLSGFWLGGFGLSSFGRFWLVGSRFWLGRGRLRGGIISRRSRWLNRRFFGSNPLLDALFRLLGGKYILGR